MMPTLVEVMYRVATRSGDAKKLVASATSADAVTFKDAQRVNSERLFWGGSEIIFLDTTHFGQWATITDADETGLLTFTPAVTGGNIASGSEAYVFDFNSKGFGVEVYKEAVQNAVADLRGRLLVKKRLEIANPYDWRDGYFTVPDTMDEIYAVEYQARDGEWRIVKPALGERGRGWRATGIDGQVQIGDSEYGGMISGYTVAALGYAELTPPEDYDDEIPEPIQPIIELAVYSLMRSGIDRDNKYPILFRPAEDQMMKMVRSYLPDRDIYSERLR